MEGVAFAMRSSRDALNGGKTLNNGTNQVQSGTGVKMDSLSSHY